MIFITKINQLIMDQKLIDLFLKVGNEIGKGSNSCSKHLQNLTIFNNFDFN